MFGKLKDKLKGALDVFSKKTEEEAEKKVEEITKEVEKKAESKKQQKKAKEITHDDSEELPSAYSLIKQTKDAFDETGELKNKPKKPVAEKLVDQEKEKVEKEKKILEEVKQKLESKEKEEEVVEEEKTGFFGKLKKSIFGKDDEEDEDLVKADELIEEANKTKEEEVPTKFDVAKQQFTPDVDQIKDPLQPLEDLDKKKEVPKKEVVKEKPEEKKGFFEKVKQTLTTKTISSEKFEELFWDLEVVLLENNVSVQVIDKIKQDLAAELVDKPLPRDVLGKINETLKKTLTEILTYDKIDLLSNVKEKKPYIIAFFGINGAGKTTSVAKIAHYLKSNGKSVVLAACDTFRAAAIQQLEEHANRLELKLIKHDYGSDAAAVAFDAIKYAEKQNIDVVLIDTAGRLHSNTNLMAELSKVIRVTQPDLKVFVGESITGNDCVEQAQKFNELVEMDASILTKADVDEKGGAPLSISYVINKPILFLGVGQEYKDLEEFDVAKVLERLGF